MRRNSSLQATTRKQNKKTAKNTKYVEGFSFFNTYSTKHWQQSNSEQSHN